MLKRNRAKEVNCIFKVIIQLTMKYTYREWVQQKVAISAACYTLSCACIEISMKLMAIGMNPDNVNFT